MAIQYTPFLELAKPDAGEIGWGPYINTNFDILDNILQHVAGSFDNVNIIKLGGEPIATNQGIATDGTMRVAVCDNDTNLSAIEANTHSSADNATSIETTLSAPLGLHILDDLDQIIGITNRPLVVFNPYDESEEIISLSVILKDKDGYSLSTGKGLATDSTLRNVSADDDPYNIIVKELDNEYTKSLQHVTLESLEELNLKHSRLVTSCGLQFGVVDRPLWISFSQNGSPLTLATGAGNWDSSTVRVVNATNDPNLAAINTQTTLFTSATGQLGWASPNRIAQLARAIDRYGTNGSLINSALAPWKGHEDGGTLTHVMGGLLGGTLKDSFGNLMGTKAYSLFYRNADNLSDRGQSQHKYFYTTVVDPIDIGNGLNVEELGGYSISRKRGDIEEGTQRICIADDDTNLLLSVGLLDIIIDLINRIINDEPEYYTVNARVIAGQGSIAPPSALVEKGDSVIFFASPASGWRIDQVLLDGINTGSKNNMQVVANVRSDHILDVGFSLLPEVTHKIIASIYGGQGNISPVGDVIVGDGEAQIFNFIPSKGWRVAKIRIDGSVVFTNETSFTFENVESDHTISVEFEQIPIIYHTISAHVSTGSGTISPSPSVSVADGANQTFSITPVSGWSTSQIIVDGVGVPIAGTYTFTNVRSDHTIIASFAKDAYIISSSVAGGQGTISPLGDTMVTSGAHQSYTMTPAAGWRRKTLSIDGVTSPDPGEIYTFSYVNSSHSISILFEEVPTQSFVITASVSGGQGTISPSGVTSVEQGSGQTYTLTPSSGWMISSISVDGIPVGHTNTTYSFTNVQANHTISVLFVQIPVNTYIISASATTGGSITPSGSVSVTAGTNKSFTYTSSAGYSLSHIVVDGAQSSPSSNTYTFTNVQANHTIQAVFISNTPTSHTITSSVSGGNGTISPAPSVTVAHGANQTFTMVPASGYAISLITVDGTSVGHTNATHTIYNVITDHSISVRFGPKYYTITSSVSGGNGTISPTPSVTVAHGANQTFTMVPASGYAISLITVDGTSVGHTNATHTIYNVITDHSISVRFGPKYYTITSSVSGEGGMISPTPSIQVQQGSNQSFTMTPANGYGIDFITVDTIKDTDPDNPYLFTNVQANHTIVATFYNLNRAGNIILFSNAEYLSAFSTHCEYLTIEVLSNSNNYGDLKYGHTPLGASCSSSTIGVVGGGRNSTHLECFVIATKSNSTIASISLSESREQLTGGGNNTRGVFAGGFVYSGSNTPESDTVEFFIISTMAYIYSGGGLIWGRRGLGSMANTTSIVFVGGRNDESYRSIPTSQIEITSISSLAKCTSCGSLTQRKSNMGSCSNSTQGLVIGGSTYTGTYVDHTGGDIQRIESINMVTTASATSVGNIVRAYKPGGANCNTTRAIYVYSNSYEKDIQYIQLSSASSSHDFGDLTTNSGSTSTFGVISSQHGGIS